MWDAVSKQEFLVVRKESRVDTLWRLQCLSDGLWNLNLCTVAMIGMGSDLEYLLWVLINTFVLLGTTMSSQGNEN